MRPGLKKPGYVAALLHRLAGIALLVFLPIHFFALAQALDNASTFESFFAITNHPLIKIAEGMIVLALATHLTLGLRVLVTELLPWREPTRALVAFALAGALGVGILFGLNVQ
jgi:fumarate reductase subunit D